MVRCVAFLLCLLLFVEAHATANVEYFAVCDAGSTGTRLYVFRLDVGQAPAKAESIFVKKTKPGLSSYAEQPEKAVSALLKLLVEGAQKVPEEFRSKTPLSILGTAGMRLLPADKQAAVWSAVRIGLTSDSAYPFDANKFEGRSVSGEEEGLWAVFTTNFLTGRMTSELKPASSNAPVGLMDLGGSSTQIAMLSAEAIKMGLPFGTDATVHSYLTFGMTYIREQIRKTMAGGADAACYMRGTKVDDGLQGTGDGAACRQLIETVVKKQVDECSSDSTTKDPCPGDFSKLPESADAIKLGSVHFYAVAGFTYVVDFVRWHLALDQGNAGHKFLETFSRPTLEEFRGAVDALCAGDYAVVEEHTNDQKKKHPFTGLDNAPYRCFQANYILVLLGDVYGFPQTSRSITFALDIDGEDLEWPLGALLHKRFEHRQKQTHFSGSHEEL